MRPNPLISAVALCLAALLGSCATVPRVRPAATPAPSASDEQVPASTAVPEIGPTATPGPTAAATIEPITWMDDAKAAFEAEVPALVKKIARKSMEKKARDRGLTLIDMAFYNEVKKEQMGQMGQ